MRFSPELRRLDWLVKRPVAHRGLHMATNGVIENTATAFEAAIDGNYAIECDLQLTGDGEAVVFHDRTLDRVTASTGRVDGFTVEQLKVVSFKASGDRIQTLAELLAQVRGRVPLVIEIKSRWNGEERLTLRALKVLEAYEGPYCLMSFDPHVMEVVRRESPSTVRGIVADRTNDEEYRELPVSVRLEMRSFSHLARTQPDFISFYWLELPWAPVNRFRQAGNPVLSWTIRSPESAAAARRYCDQITFERFLP
jgi:glycerophosphoryl diester phosphodiesterase